MRYLTVEPAPSRFVPQGRKRARYEMRTRFAGAPGYVPHEPVRAHVLELVRLGLPMTSIARDAECADSCVANLSRGVWKSVRIRQATAIMAVTFHPNERQQIVIAIGAIRRLRALHAIGWTWRALAEEIPDVTEANLAKLSRQNGRTVIAWKTWAAIRDAYERLSGTPGTWGRAGLARKTSADRRWAAPLLWHDLDIDDPRVQPDIGVLDKGSLSKSQTVSDERAAEVQRLTTAGLSASAISERMGLSDRQVVRLRSRRLTS